MGGGKSKGSGYGNTVGAGSIAKSLPLVLNHRPFSIGKSIGAAALNYSVKDPRSGVSFKFVEGTTIHNVQTFAGHGVRNKLKPQTLQGLVKEFGGRPKNWKHVKGIGTLNFYGRPRQAEVHWFEEKSVGKVKFRVKVWLEK